MKRIDSEYTESPWSGETYEHSPTVDELTRESKDVLKSNSAIVRTMRPEAMDSFIEAYKAQHGLGD